MPLPNNTRYPPPFCWGMGPQYVPWRSHQSNIALSILHGQRREAGFSHSQVTVGLVHVRNGGVHTANGGIDESRPHWISGLPPTSFTDDAGRGDIGGSYSLPPASIWASVTKTYRDPFFDRPLGGKPGPQSHPRLGLFRRRFFCYFCCASLAPYITVCIHSSPHLFVLQGSSPPSPPFTGSARQTKYQ